MLPAANRMRKADDFSATIREGQRSGNKTLVIHVVANSYTNEADRKVGFIVAKNVGNSVVRHRVYRRLRHIVRDRLPRLPIESMVVRALPSAATASSNELRRALERELKRTNILEPTGVGEKTPGKDEA